MKDPDYIFDQSLVISELLHAGRIHLAASRWETLRVVILHKVGDRDVSDNYSLEDAHDWGHAVWIDKGGSSRVKCSTDLEYYSDRWCVWRVAYVDAMMAAICPD